MDNDTFTFNCSITVFKGEIIVAIGYNYEGMMDNLYTQQAIKESRM